MKHAVFGLVLAGLAVSVPAQANDALAKKYNARLVALTMAEGMIPVGADERVSLALERLIPHMLEIDFPITDLIIDPLVLTVSGCQEYCPEFIEAVRALKFSWDPPPLTNVLPALRLTTSVSYLIPLAL